MIKYKVTLSDDERRELTDISRKGHSHQANIIII
jgi:hypothetical protein